MSNEELLDIYGKSYRQLSDFVRSKCEGLNHYQIADVIDAVSHDDKIMMDIVSSRTTNIHVRMKEIPEFCLMI